MSVPNIWGGSISTYSIIRIYSKLPVILREYVDFVQMTSTIFTFFHSDEQIKISNTRFLQTIVYNMKQAIIGKGPKMILFSAHDTTLMSLWAAFNLTNIACLTEYYLDGVQNG